MTSVYDHSTLSDIYNTQRDIGSLKNWFYDWGGANEWIFQQVNAIHGKIFDAIMIGTTALGDRHNIIFFLPAIFIAMLLAVTIRKIRGKTGTRQYLIVWFGVFLVLLCAFPIYAYIISVLKDFFHYPRPYLILDDVVVLEHRPGDDGYHSFPSGHSAFITYIVAALWPVMGRGWRTLGVWLIFAVMWSRLTLGVHFPADVVGGFLIALLITKLTRVILYKLLGKFFKLHCG